MGGAASVAPQVVARRERQVLLAALAGGSAGASQRLARWYRLDRDAAYAHLAAVNRTTVVTRFGTVEYAERGSGEPLLAIHGFSAAATRRCLTRSYVIFLWWSASAQVAALWIEDFWLQA
jgi:hypothetical protein